MSTRRTVWTVTAIIAVVLAAIVGFGAFALARTDGGRGPWQHRGWGHPQHQTWGPSPEQVRQIRTHVAAELGAELDQPSEKVEAAFRAVVARRLQEEVAAGELDQAESEQALAAYDEGDLRELFHLIKRDW